MQPRCHQILISPEVGGAALIALNVARHVRDQGRDCRVWLPSQGRAWNEAARLGLTCHAYDSQGALSQSRIRAGLANWRLARALRTQGGGLVHVHAPLFYGALRWGLKRADVKRIVHVHLEEALSGWQWAFRDPPEMIVTCARFLVSLVERSLPETSATRPKIVAVPNAVDAERFHPGPKAAAKLHVGAPAEKPLALMLANLAPHKGQETAIKSIALLRNRGVHVACWLAGIERDGTGVYTRRLQALIAEAGVGDRVRLLGQRSDAPDLMRAADFFLLPSTQEGLPLSVLEAQASRIPVLAAPTAGVPEVVHDGETGFLIAADNAEGYAQRMQHVLSNTDHTENMIDAAYRKIVDEHSWPAYCGQIVALYESMLAIPPLTKAQPDLATA